MAHRRSWSRNEPAFDSRKHVVMTLKSPSPRSIPHRGDLRSLGIFFQHLHCSSLSWGLGLAVLLGMVLKATSGESGVPILTRVPGPPPTGVAQPLDDLQDPGALYLRPSIYGNRLPLSRQSRLRIPLDGERDITAILERSESKGDSREVWIGSAENTPGSRVILARMGEALSGTLWIPGRGVFQIQPRPQGWHRLGKIWETGTAGCGVVGGFQSYGSAPPPSPSSPAPLASPLDSSPAPLPSLDILVLYTAAARQGAGSSDGMVALIDTLMEELNESFSNSGVKAVARLVHSEETSYSETGNLSADLRNLEEDDDDYDGDDDGHRGDRDHSVPEVHDLRRQYGADLVCMVVEKTDGPLGIANVMRNLSTDFYPHAFSVVQRAYANSYLSFVHEVGHNLGCQHDRGSASGPGLFPFSYGFRFEQDHIHYRTVMASPPGLPIPYFSNPDISFSGIPVGIALDATNSADNAESVTRAAPWAAQFSERLNSGSQPKILLVEPTDGGEFAVAASIECEVQWTPSNLNVRLVEFLSDGEIIGTANDRGEFYWSATTPGEYHIQARATLSTGEQLLSAKVEIYVTGLPPRLETSGCARLEDGSFRLQVVGTEGQRYRIDTSRDLIQWSPFVTNQLPSSAIFERDPCEAGEPTRFYRLTPIRY